MKSGINTYQETAITTQSKGQIIVLLYDGAIKFLKQAIAALGEDDFASKGIYITKAKDIINELNAALDIEAGGEIAENLRKLYAFMITHLNQANTKKDPAMITEVITMLEELNQSWKAITK